MYVYLCMQINVIFIFSDPVPGACNQEFPLENDPNLFIPQRRFIHPVEFQYANIQAHSGGVGKVHSIFYWLFYNNAIAIWSWEDQKYRCRGVGLGAWIVVRITSALACYLKCTVFCHPGMISHTV